MSVAPRFDTFDNVPEFDALRTALLANDWPAFEPELLKLPPDEISYALTLFAATEEVDGRVDVILSPSDEAPESSPALLTARAVRMIALAWAARGRAAAPAIARESFESFFAQLREAEQLLIRVCARYPDFGPAWSARLTTARGLQLGTSEARRRFTRRESTQHDFSAQLALLLFLDPKWFGTKEAALEFARTTTETSSWGSNSGALIPIYYIERWAEAGGALPGQALLKAPGVVDELRMAAGRSVLHEGHRMSPLGVLAHNAFLMCFWIAGQERDALAHLEVVGDRGAEMYWHYANHPEQLMTTAWEEIRAAGSVA